MNFTFTEDQQAFAEGVRAFLQGEVTAESIRAGWDTETGRNSELWKKMVEMGLPSMLVPEAYGGLGMNELDFVLMAQECGRVALPEPIVETALVAVPLLASLASTNEACAKLLTQIAEGTAMVAVGHSVNGLVSDAHVADYLLLSSGDQIHLLEKSQVDCVAQESVDPSRKLFTVAFNATKETCIASGALGVSLLAATLNRGALGAAAQLLGLSEAMVEQTVAYTADRKQFGKAIGVNQALKHHMANCAVKNEFAKAPLYRAAFTVSENPVHADYAVSHAKVACGEAALLAAKNSIQSHGAMGYTWECNLHIWMKKSWALDKNWGHVGFHKSRFHQWLLNPQAKIGADMTFGVQA